MTDEPIVGFASAAELDAWLTEHHESSAGIRLKLAKKGAGVASVTHAEAVELALCFGWIDSKARTIDERFWTLRFTPRSARSKWSKVNVAKATELIASGAMRPAGLREVERAQADGRWEAAYHPPSTATVPDDLQRALDADPAVAEVFAGLDSRNRYAILHRIHDAKKPETRARRIAKYVAMLAAGERIY